MPRLNIPATKINLIRIKEEMRLAQEGYDLLEQKRQVLIMETMRLMDGLSETRAQVEPALATAYERLAAALVEAGTVQVARAGLAAGTGVEITLRERSVMGIVTPIVDVEERDFQPPYGLLGVHPSVDEALKAFREAMEHITKLAELENAALRLATELKKTQRRVNALQNFFIPQYHETAKYLQDTLEERERDALFALKLVKAKAAE